MKFRLLIFCLLAATLVSGQVALDIIYLKDGTIYKGNVAEYKPGEEVIFKLIDDRIITIPTTDIYTMKVEDDRIIKKQFEIKDRGYFNQTLAGLQWGRNEFNNMVTSVQAYTLNGWQIDRRHMGLGIGIENHAGNWYTPISADYSFHILDDHTDPIVGINGGYMLPLGDNLGEQYGYTTGYFIGGKVGLIAHSSAKFAFVLHINYRYIHLSGAEYRFFGFREQGLIEGEADLHRIGLTMGVAFN